MFYPHVLFEILANKAKKQQKIRGNNSNKRLWEYFSQNITNVALDMPTHFCHYILSAFTIFEILAKNPKTTTNQGQ
jgi:hypothetical protein